MGRGSGGSGSGFGSKGGGGLARSLSTHEATIRGNNYETLTAFDENGNMLFTKKGGAHSVAYGADGVKTTNAIVTHNHPSGGSFSWQDVGGMVYYNQKEMRATGKEFTFSLKRPATGWGVSPDKAAARFKKALASSRRAFRKQKTGDAAKDRALWISLTHKYNGNAAKSLGWDYSVKKNK